MDKFFKSLMDKPVIFDKGLVLPDKLNCLSKTGVSNARGSPRGMLMLSPRAAIKLRMTQPRANNVRIKKWSIVPAQHLTLSKIE